jgi:hypothetical protein
VPNAMRRRVRAYVSSGKDISRRGSEKRIMSLLSPALQVGPRPRCSLTLLDAYA